MPVATRPKAVIFDWDDTLVDTWHVVRNAINVTLEAMGGTPWTEDEARQRIGPPAKVLFSSLFGEDRWQEADRIYINAYVEGIKEHLRMHDGAAEIVLLLKEQDVPLFVVSTKRGELLRQEATLLGLAAHFEKLVGAGDAPKDKPNAEAVIFALEDSGIAPGPDVWFIGDSHTDMKIAHASGCLPVLIETKPPSEEALAATPPAHRLKTHDELMAFVSERVLPQDIGRQFTPRAPF